MTPYDHTKFGLKNHQEAGSAGQKVVKIPKKLEKLSPAKGGGTGVDDMSTYLCQHRWDIAQTFMVDSPSDNIQTHKVLGPKSPRCRDGGQKSLENPQKS